MSSAEDRVARVQVATRSDAKGFLEYGTKKQKNMRKEACPR